MSERPWWIVLTQPSMERRCGSGLVTRGFETWFPERLVQYRAKHMKRPCERRYPTWPGYVFARPTGTVPVWRWQRQRNEEGHTPCVAVQIDTASRDANWREAEGVDGYRGMLTNDGVSCTIRADDLQGARDYLDDLANKPIPIEVWRKNDAARICDGPFNGFDAVVVGDEVRGRVEVILRLFAQETHAHLLTDQLRRVA